MNKDDLKPCPFCASENIETDYDDKRLMCDTAECIKCGALVPLSEWNLRTQQSEWNSIYDMLPETDDEFLVVAHGDVKTCRFNPWRSDPSKNREHSYMWYDEEDVPNYGSERFNVGGVTHWMPLPNPPKGD